MKVNVMVQMTHDPYDQGNCHQFYVRDTLPIYTQRYLHLTSPVIIHRLSNSKIKEYTTKTEEVELELEVMDEIQNRYNQFRIAELSHAEKYYADVCIDLGIILGSYLKFPEECRGQIRDDLAVLFENLVGIKELNSIRAANELIDGPLKKLIDCMFGTISGIKVDEERQLLRNIYYNGWTHVITTRAMAERYYTNPNRIALTSLPDDVIKVIFEKMDYEALVNSNLVCRDWRARAGSMELWKKLVHNDVQRMRKMNDDGTFGFAVPYMPNPNINWRLGYRRQFLGWRWNLVLPSKCTRIWCQRCFRVLLTRDMPTQDCINAANHCCTPMTPPKLTRYVLTGIRPTTYGF